MLWFLLFACRVEVPVELYDPEGRCDDLIECTKDVDTELSDDFEDTYGRFGSCWSSDEAKGCVDECRQLSVSIAVNDEVRACRPDDPSELDAVTWAQGIETVWCNLAEECTPFDESRTCVKTSVGDREDRCFDAENAWSCLDAIEALECPRRGMPAFPEVCRDVWSCESAR